MGLKCDHGQQCPVSRTEDTPPRVVLPKEGLELLKSILPGEHSFLWATSFKVVTSETRVLPSNGFCLIEYQKRALHLTLIVLPGGRSKEEKLGSRNSEC